MCLRSQQALGHQRLSSLPFGLRKNVHLTEPNRTSFLYRKYPQMNLKPETNPANADPNGPQKASSKEGPTM